MSSGACVTGYLQRGLASWVFPPRSHRKCQLPRSGPSQALPVHDGIRLTKQEIRSNGKLDDELDAHDRHQVEAAVCAVSYPVPCSRLLVHETPDHCQGVGGRRARVALVVPWASRAQVA